MQTRGAIELSVNMLVIIIISIVILGGGIALLYKFIDFGQQAKMDLDSRTEAELQRLLLQEGKQVALPLNKVELKRGDEKVFGLGVLNTLTPTAGATEVFSVMINPSAYLPPQGESQENPEVLSWLLYDPEAFSLKEQESKQIPISVSVPVDAVTGIYIFDVKVQKSDGQRYGAIQKIQIEVE